MSADDVKVLLSVRCMSLHIRKKANFSLGLISSVMQMATGPTTAKHEKRRIKISQSASFEPTGRPPSLLYDFIAQSELFEDKPDVTPGLMVEIMCPARMDCKIRVNVYYSSNLTGGKEVVLAGTTFNLRELLRHNKLFTSVMNSEHCVGAKAVVDVASPFPPILTSTALYPMQMPRRNHYRNPYIQHYCFFHEDDISSPLVDCQEVIWEPKFSFRIPALYLDNITDRLAKCIVAWKQRYELERMRQGRFRSDDEALRNGWHVMKLTIVGTKFSHMRDNAAARREGSKMFQPDNLCTGSYVEALFNNNNSTFSMNIGRTNTECFNNTPLYGSNLHPASNRKDQVFTVTNPAVQLLQDDKIFQFRCVDPSRAGGDRNTSADVVSVHGTINHFKAYIPDCKNSCLKLNLFADFQDSTDSSRDRGDARDPRDNPSVNTALKLVGYGFVPLLENEKEQETTVRVMMNETYSTYFEAEIRVRVSMTSPAAGTLVAPSSFPSVVRLNPETIFKDTLVGSPEHCMPPRASVVEHRGSADSAMLSSSSPTTAAAAGGRQPVKMSSISFNAEQVISECYDWMWLIGYSGYDPLSGSAINSTRRESSAGVSGSESGSAAVVHRMNRADVEYSLEWIDEHVRNVEGLYRELRYLCSETISKEAQSDRFRSSTKKKEREYQVLPTNLHLQLMLSRRHVNADELSTGFANAVTVSPAASASATGGATATVAAAAAGGNAIHIPYSPASELSVTDSVTCGCPSPHGLGHKHGGLEILEIELSRQRQAVEMLKEQYFNVVGDNTGLSPTGAAAQLLSKISTQLKIYESNALNAAKRRIYATSQALSTAVNGIMMKLALVIEGFIPAETAHSWARYGMLVLFEGLLSITGHERSMIEDTMVAVDALRLFSVRIVSCPDPPGGPIKVTPGASIGPTPGNTATRAGGRESHSATSSPDVPLRNTVPSSTVCPPGSEGSTYSPIGYATYMHQHYIYGMYVTMSGREVTLHIPESTHAKLPECLRQPMSEGSPNVVIRIISVLVNQGIDIQQSMATAFGSSSGGSQEAANGDHLGASDLQHFINMRALKLLNDYSHRSRPLENAVYVPSGTSMATTVAGVSAAGVRDTVNPAFPTSPSPGSGSGATAGAASAASSSSAFVQPTNIAASDAMGFDIIHPVCKRLDEYVRYSNVFAKNVDLLLEAERVCSLLNGLRVTFCKSGKDRTGMAVTLEQSRVLGERFSCGYSQARILRDANLMREHGCRLMIAEKNIGRKVYSINSLQSQFIPVIYRPPVSTQENLIKSGDLS